MIDTSKRYLMRNLIPTLPLIVFLMSSSTAIAKDYSGRCLYIDQENSESKFRSCLINTTKSTLVTTFKNDKFQKGNKSIKGSQIIQIASGNYAKRLLSDSGSIIGRIIFSPIGLVSGLFKKDSQEYVIDYKQKGREMATVIRVEIKQAPEFQQELRVLTREKIIRFDDPKRSNIINVGPNLK